jgi:hypothetical protein
MLCDRRWLWLCWLCSARTIKIFCLPPRLSSIASSFLALLRAPSNPPSPAACSRAPPGAPDTPSMTLTPPTTSRGPRFTSRSSLDRSKSSRSPSHSPVVPVASRGPSRPPASIVIPRPLAPVVIGMVSAVNSRCPPIFPPPSSQSPRDSPGRHNRLPRPPTRASQSPFGPPTVRPLPSPSPTFFLHPIDASPGRIMPFSSPSRSFLDVLIPPGPPGCRRRLPGPPSPR